MGPELPCEMPTRNVGGEPSQLPDKGRFDKERLGLGQAGGDNADHRLKTRFSDVVNPPRLHGVRDVKHMGGFPTPLAFAVIEFFEVAGIDIGVDVILAHLPSRSILSPRDVGR
jgi:hypothetical protein